MSAILRLVTVLVVACACVSCAAGSHGRRATAPKVRNPYTEPRLRLDPGMHTSRIGRISADASARFLATCSADKTVRVWSLADGSLLQTLRPPTGDGHEGKIYCVAMSPDGETVACGGWTGYDWDGTHSVYLFERRTGRLVRRLAGQPNVIIHMAFSPDGTRLGASLGGQNGVRVWDTSSWRLVGQDTAYGDQSYGLTFDSQGRMATTCYDTYLRLYDRDMRLAAKIKAPGGVQPYSLAFSPDDALLAVGYGDQSAVDVFNAGNLTLAYTPDNAGLKGGDLMAVAWSRDGQSLFAAGQYDENNFNPVLRWEQGGRGKRSVFLKERITNSVMDLVTLSSDELAVGSYDPAWAVCGMDGRIRLFQGPPISDYRAVFYGEFGISADGATVSFGYRYGGKGAAMLSLSDLTLRQGPAQGLAAPVTEMPGLEVKDWEDKFKPTCNGKPLQLEKYERSRSLALFPGGSGFVLGSNWNVYCFDAQGNQRWKTPAGGTAWGVNVSGDGRLVLAALADGTLRWYRARDGHEMLAFYPHPDRQRWVVWTPEGYYHASPGADDLIGWHTNRGKAVAADFFEIGQFSERFHRPTVVSEILNTLDIGQALTRAKTRPQTVGITELLPPVVSILSPDQGESHAGGRVEVRYSVRSVEPVTGVTIFLDGKPVAEQGGLEASEQGVEHSAQIDVPDRDVTLGVSARNRHGQSRTVTVTLPRGR